MRFAIRDDDLNYFYSEDMIEENIKDIWDICPISMSAVPFIKGNWPKNTKILEDLGPGNVSSNILNNMINDNKVYDIAKNKNLVKYIKEKIIEGKVYITIHAIHHRNEDDVSPQVGKNFAIGAEFYTNRDLTKELSKAVKHLEKIFEQKIEVFTPPQNLYSEKGFEAVIANYLNFCAYPPSVKNNIFQSIKILGVNGYLKILFHKFTQRDNKKTPYPKLLKINGALLMDHVSLQLGSSIDDLYKAFDSTYSKGGDFVLSTHSYGFNYKMMESDETMGEVLKTFLEYVSKKEDVEFVTLNKLFEKEN